MKLRKALVSFVIGVTLAVVPIFAMPSIQNSISQTIARTSQGCPYFMRLTIDFGDGAEGYSCYRTGEDADWCYYTCYHLNY